MPPKKVSLPPNPPPDPSQNLPLAYSTFFSVAPLNAKNVSSSYLKTEAQTWISRSQAALAAQQNLGSRGKKRKRAAAAAAAAAPGADPDDADATLYDDAEDSDDDDAAADDADAKPSGPASRTIVIHPGSEFIRIGRATDLYPLTVPNAIARRPKLPLPQPPAPNGAQTDDASANAPGYEGGQDDSKVQGDAKRAEDDGIETPEPETRPGAGTEAAQAAKNGDAKSSEEPDHDRDQHQHQEQDPEAEAGKGGKKGKEKGRLDQGIEKIRNELRAIMRQEKLRPVGNGKTLAANYNDGVTPEDVPEHNDLFGLDWTETDVGGANTVVVGEKALRLACFSQPKTEKPKQTRRQPVEAATADPTPDRSRPWKLFRPFKCGTLDLNAYEEHYGASAAVQVLLGDVRAILEHAIASPPEDSEDREESGEVVARGLGIPLDEWEEYSVILILPDLFSRSDLKALVELLLQDMGFAAACVQNEGVCATFGAGLSSACVVDLGAERISISCVEEGLVLPETRVALSYGGRDLSCFLGELFVRSKFPYREIDWHSNAADAMLLDSLKERLVTLNPADVGLNIHDFYLRLPGRPTVKYLFRTYDELILGPMSLFDPDVYGLDAKKLLKAKLRAGVADEPASDEGVTDDAPELSVGSGMELPVTMAMQSCVRHLLPPPPTAEAATPAGSAPLSDPSAAAPKLEEDNSQVASRNASPAGSVAAGGGCEGASANLAGGEASARPSPSLAAAAATQPPLDAAGASQQPEAVAAPPKPTIDIPFEASKTSLDQAVFNSILACVSATGSAGEERVKKMANNILCVGGSALIPGLGSALEAR
ncbi:Actin-like protein arp8 [Thecaphora frezii]